MPGNKSSNVVVLNLARFLLEFCESKSLIFCKIMFKLKCVVISTVDTILFLSYKYKACELCDARASYVRCKLQQCLTT